MVRKKKLIPHSAIIIHHYYLLLWTKPFSFDYMTSIVRMYQQGYTKILFLVY